MKKVSPTILNIVLAAIWTYFVYLDTQSFLLSQNPIVLLIALSQAQFVFLVLVRKDAASSSKSLFDYFISFVGSFIILLLYRPATASVPYELAGVLLIYFAMLFQIFGFLSLGTSAGIIPANRGIKTGGLYGFVRHPIYLGTMLLCAGYFILNPIVYNAIILLLAAVCQIIRIDREEKILIKDGAYEKYAAKVKWKLLPGVY